MLDILFAQPCLICKRPTDRATPFTGLCSGCVSQLPWRTTDFSLPWPQDVLPNLTAPDHSADPAVIRAIQNSSILAACHYHSPVRDGILALKFSDATEWHRPLSALLINTVRRTAGHYDAVLAVPLHQLRLQERGYNQSGLLAAAVARQLHLPDWSHLLRRDQVTCRQSDQPSRQERLANLSGAFSWQGPPNLKSIQLLLVDDVLTTGATLGAAAEPLFRQGACVTGLVVATNQVLPQINAKDSQKASHRLY